jgi:hypothetical protein
MLFTAPELDERELVADGGDEITEATAGRDLKALAGAGFLVARGEKRGRHYVAGAPLLEVCAEVAAARTTKDRADPFVD